VQAKTRLLDNLVNHFEKRIPGLKIYVDAFILTIAQLQMNQRLREINKLPNITDEEFKAEFPRYFNEALKHINPNFDESKLIAVAEYISKIIDLESITSMEV
jgi:hypothetical protein